MRVLSTALLIASAFSGSEDNSEEKKCFDEALEAMSNHICQVQPGKTLSF